MLTLQALHSSNPVKGDVQILHVQISELKVGQTAALKPYLGLTIADSTGQHEVKIWSEAQAFSAAQAIGSGNFVELTSSFSVNSYGLNLHDPSVRVLTDEERETLLAGSPEAVATAQAEWAEALAAVESMQSVPLKKLCTALLQHKGVAPAYRRAAAANKNHHARRGGLLSHSVAMLRSVRALAPLYGANIDLLSAGALFHDLGKVSENDVADGFAVLLSNPGELCGHIMVGAEIVNAVWREVVAADPEMAKENLTRLHLLHLIASHHGTKEFGSPVVPKTPEAMILHFVDTLDASLEMMRMSYEVNDSPAPGFIEGGWPLKRTLLPPLPMVGAQQF